MAFDQSLFDLSPAERSKVKQAIGKAAKRAQFLGRMIRLYGAGPDGKRCKACAHFYVKQFSGSYPKCRFAGDSNGRGTDWKANQLACGKFEERPAEPRR